MKSHILNHLSQSEKPVSGETLSQKLGVSRVAIWKHIRQLQEHGYDIEATPKGYRLLSGPDTPFPWVFGQRAARVLYFPIVNSTMDEAMTLARDGCPDFTVVVADRQTKGRGRLARQWQSIQGGLYFTMVLRPNLLPAESALINLAAAVDMAETLISLYGVKAQLKWPNDILVGHRKLVGILSQMAAESDRIDFVNLGIGVNVYNDTKNVHPPAVSLVDLTHQPVSRSDVLITFWDRFEKRIKDGDLQNVIEQWKQYAVTLGRNVSVQTLKERIEGKAVDIEPNGGLILETAAGERKTIIYGDCFHKDN